MLFSILTRPTRLSRLLPFCFVLLGVGLPVAGQEMIMLDEESLLVLPELAALAQMQGDELRIHIPLPAGRRPAANRELDIQRGDVILMIDGKRIRDLATARAVYGAAEEGTEVAMAMQRGEDRRIIRFDKMAETSIAELMGGGPGHDDHGAEGSGVVMQRLVLDGGAPPQAFAPLGVLAADSDDGLKVMMVLPMVETSLLKDDVILSVGGKAVKDAESLQAMLGTLEGGSEVEVKVRRGDAEEVLRQTLSDAEIRMSMESGR